MKTTGFSILLIWFAIFAYAANTFAQDSPQSHLPEGATARLGKGWITEIAYSPDGTRLAVASSIGIWLYDAQTGEALDLLTGHTDGVYSVSFSPDGNTLASGSDGTVRLWDANTGSPLRTLTGHTDNWSQRVVFTRWQHARKWKLGQDRASVGCDHRQSPPHAHRAYVWVSSVSFSPDGNTLASGSRDKTVRLWDATTGSPLRTLTGHTSLVSSVSFSPDGNTLASGSRDNTVRLWDATTGSPLRTLTGHTSPVLSVSFSPDGNTLASASLDKTVRLWDATTGSPLRTLTGHTSWGLQRVVFTRWQHARKWKLGQDRASVGCDHRQSAAHAHRAYGYGLQRVVFTRWQHARKCK